MRIEDLYARKRHVPLESRDVPAVCLEDELVLNCIHGAKHFWERLMWPADIAAIVARHPEIAWECVRQAARDVGAERMLHVGLLLSESLLGVAVPAEMAASANYRWCGAGNWCGWSRAGLPTAGYAATSFVTKSNVPAENGRRRAGRDLLPGTIVASPTEEDWAEGRKSAGSRVWEAIQEAVFG